MGTDDQQHPSDLMPEEPEEPGERENSENSLMGETASVERYHRAHGVIERMRADRRPDRSDAIDDDLPLDVTAALLRSVTPGAASIDPGFAARLFTRLEAGAPLTSSTVPAATRATPLLTQSEQAARAVAAPTTPEGANAPARPKRGNGVSRRGLMLGGLSAAAAAVVGGAVGVAMEAESQSGKTSSTTTVPTRQPLIPDGVGSWVAVATVASVPMGAVVRFQTDAVIGYLRHSSDGFVALSGVCTHMACLLQWNGLERTFDCPCHGSRFSEDGKQAPGARYSYPPLPAIKTKVEDAQVYVYVISTAGSTPATSEPGSGRGGY